MRKEIYVLETFIRDNGCYNLSTRIKVSSLNKAKDIASRCAGKRLNFYSLAPGLVWGALSSDCERYQITMIVIDTSRQEDFIL